MVRLSQKPTAFPGYFGQCTTFSIPPLNPPGLASLYRLREGKCRLIDIQQIMKPSLGGVGGQNTFETTIIIFEKGIHNTLWAINKILKKCAIFLSCIKQTGCDIYSSHIEYPDRRFNVTAE